MAIAREYDTFTVVCDVCSEELRDFETFQDALDELEKNGWRRGKSKSGAWENYCPKCARS